MEFCLTQDDFDNYYDKSTGLFEEPGNSPLHKLECDGLKGLKGAVRAVASVVSIIALMTASQM